MRKTNYLITLLLLLFVQFTHGQMNQIMGTVTDASGSPVPGVNILVQGTNSGTVTDFDGNYIIDASDQNTLVFNYIGFQTEEELIGGRQAINVTLTEDTEALDAVIVIAYGTSSKKDLTGSVSTVTSEDLSTFPASNVDQALQGKSAGIQVTQNSGAPGAGISVNIRGVGTFGDTTPLYVVDGFPTTDITYLNPNDIQSISVLKDASAGALYGVRASNGVVIIETKKGNKGDMRVSVDSWAGVTVSPNFVDVLDATQFATLAKEIGTAQENGSSPLPEEWNNPSALRNINWQDQVFRTGFRTGHSLSVRGGGEKLKAAFTAGLLDEEGTVIESSYKRYNVGMNMSFDVSEKFTVTGDLKYAYSKQFENLPQGYYNLLRVFANVPYLSNITDTNLPFDNNGNFGTFPVGERFIESSNIIAGAKRRDNDNNRNVFLGNFSAKYDFLNGFSATLNFGVNSQNFARWDFNPKYFISKDDRLDQATYGINQTTANEYIVEALIGYDKQIGKHKIGLLAAASSQRNQAQNIFVESQGFLNNEIRDLNAAENISNRRGTFTRRTLASQFARLNYDYDSKYYITATIRRDGVGDKFGANNLYGIFPAVAASWNVDQESFMENGPFDIFKLRASWGETGSFAGIPGFQFLGYYNNGSTVNDAGYVFGGELAQGLQPTGLPNPNLQWETQKQFNVGIDGELLRNRMYFTADWFRKESADFLFPQVIPAQLGFTNRSVNGGNVLNEGFEILLGYRKSTGDFTFDISANFTKIKNSIVDIAGDVPYTLLDTEFTPGFVDNWQGVTRSYEGGNIGTFFGYRSDGIFQNQSQIDVLNNAAPEGKPYQSNGTAPGDRKFRDLNGDGIITGEDREVIGTPMPDFFGGVNLTLSYKNVDLGIDIYGTYGNDILNFTRVEQESFGGFGRNASYTNISVDYFENRWTETNPSNTYARAILQDDNKNNRVSDHFVEDGSFLRLRNVKLAYNLPDIAIKKLGLSNLKFYVSVQNIVTLTNYSGWDPEIGQVRDQNGNSGVQSRGIDFASYPVTPTYTMGINIQL